MLAFHQRFEHHLILRVDEQSAEQTQQFLNGILPSILLARILPVQRKKVAKLSLHRFAVAGRRYDIVIPIEQRLRILRLDVTT